ncbi:unnamed protein product [Acanthoscelides obtectus]|nr:unnamed protein product [Acanthoscelides obtectus]CAH1991088.1 unnamed protein product [Acanthoscelides obtectus]CAK1634394.1 hypothetical protein AOBTE_LOCUS8743 [Acanthoscelides obtectus]CAK1687782.1 hypothetical protein AOBTE_LOCUS36363 [Acanthoscelides obtectus]
MTTTSSRASSTQRSYVGGHAGRSSASFASRRASSAPGSRTTVASQSRAGSRRPSIASIHSSTSVRSYSARRYERERREKEERELERRFKLAASSAGSVSGVGVGQPSPSPHSVDDLLPTLEEDRQGRVEEVPPLAAKEDSTSSFPEELPSTSKQYP